MRAPLHVHELGLVFAHRAARFKDFLPTRIQDLGLGLERFDHRATTELQELHLG